MNNAVPILKATPKHLLTGMELSEQDILGLINLALSCKKNPEKYARSLQGKTLAMLFEKPSFRTRLSFNLAITSLGGRAIESVNNNRKVEEPKDLIRVLNAYCDFVMIRTHDDNDLAEMAEFSTIPIINALTALYHPCQILADLLSLQEHFGRLHGITLSYVGVANNVLHSLLLMAPKVGVKVNYCCPEKLQPETGILANCNSEMITSFIKPEEAVQNSHAVYTDVWVSMGFSQQEPMDLSKYQVNEALMAKARKNAVFMHCMPMERGKEVSTTLPDKPCSLIFSQSENRLHVQKAILLSCF